MLYSLRGNREIYLGNKTIFFLASGVFCYTHYCCSNESFVV